MNRKKRPAVFAGALALALPILGLNGSAQTGDPWFKFPPPPPYRQADVGDVGIAGSSGESEDGDLSVVGAGSDIWGTADSFHFVYQPIADGEIRANSPGQDATNPFAKVGIMIRQSLDPGSPHVILDVKPDGSLEFMTRSVLGGDTRFVAGGTFQPAPELHLLRSAGTVTAVVCTFGNVPGCQTLGSVPFPSGMALAGAAVTSHDPNTLNHGMFPASPPTVMTVPMPWSHGDVGDVGLAGSAFSENGTFTVSGAGADIWGTADAFQLVANFLTGDGVLLARITSEQAANPFAKAGIIMAGPSPGFPSEAKVILDVRPNGVVEFMARSSDGAAMEFLAGSAASFPVWLKLRRVGDTVAGFTSSDGENWRAVGTTRTAWPRDLGILGGLAVTSHDTAALNTSTFDHVQLAGAISAESDIGDVGIAGGSVSGSGTSTLHGGGGDIWGTADAFNYLYQYLNGDGQMAVRIDSLDDTDRFAKAGLMIRDSLDPSAAQVIVDVTPSSLVEVLTRTDAGAETQWVGGLSPTSFPIWLKLTRSGNMYDAWASSDDVTWTHLTQAFPNIQADALIGLAVTSHVRGVLTSATFDHLSR